MGKADEERLAIGVQIYPCLYDKAVSAIHNKNLKKCLGSSSKGYWLRNRRGYKECFHKSPNEICETKEDLERLKKVWNRCRKSNESRKGHAGVSFSLLVGQFVYE